MNVLLSVISALMLSTGAVAAPADTVDVYVVDGKVIDNFDGSQISGNIILSYKIERSANLPQRTHIITTRSSDKTYFIPYYPAEGGMTIVNGQAIGLGPSDWQITDSLSDYFDKLPPGSIVMSPKKGMISYDKSDVVVKTEPGKGVVYDFSNAAYVLNGKRISKKEFDKLDLTTIVSISVIKDPKQIQKYNIGNYRVIISIVTK